jgi:hypothetical protein
MGGIGVGGGSGALIVFVVLIAVLAAGAGLFALNRCGIAQGEGLARLRFLIDTVGKIVEGGELSVQARVFLDERGLDAEVLRGVAGPVVAAASAEFMYLAKLISLRVAVAATQEVARGLGGRQALGALRRVPACGLRVRLLRRRTPVDGPGPAGGGGR